jgi:hypothetical protein
MVKFFLTILLLSFSFNVYSQTQQNRLLYFGVGYGVSSMITLISQKNDYKYPYAMGFVGGTLTGMTKQLYDSYVTSGSVNGVDVLSSALGSGIACLTLRIPIKNK